MNEVRCFLIKATENVRLYLRRYRGESKCEKCPHKYHDVRVDIGVRSVRYSSEKIGEQRYEEAWSVSEFADDPRWPTAYPCGEPVKPDDHQQVFSSRLYRREDGAGEEMERESFPPGAMWDAWWYGRSKLPDGMNLMVRLPDGRDWFIDGVANNCTLPEDREHKCWVRHGKAPLITVDKNGKTCAAGAGSIATKGYHGFLRNGVLIKC